MNRRQTLTGLLSACLPAIASTVQPAKPPRILLRSSWQTVNIGDIAHTPGMLALLEKQLPMVEVRLWPGKLDNGVEELLRARFPKVFLANTKESLAKAFKECDFLLHGSGPSLVAEKDVLHWISETGKPFGIGGITLPLQGSTALNPATDKVMAQTIGVLDQARFVFFRDSASMELAKARGCKCPVLEFGPDGAFATDLRDDARALAFMEANGLKEGKFLCCIPRLRYTPYWKVPSKKAPFDERKHARNEAMKEHDHAPLRLAIIEVLKQTDMRVLICPEDQTQMAVGKELLFDPLPGELKSRAVWKPDYWLPGEALSTYTRCAGLFGNEMHSPIMCVGNGVPAIVCRWAEQTTKGLMWRDIGLGDWLFDLDNKEDVRRVVPAVLEMARDPSAARAKTEKARSIVRQRQARMMELVGRNLPR